MPIHDKLIAQAAKRHLQPLGGIRQGRSRIWLADAGWYVAVVEFQPSSWSRGAYLNVGAHFLWQPSDNITFDYGHRKKGHVEFEDEKQFTAAADVLAAAAAQEVITLRAIFPDPRVVHTMTPGNTGQSWIDRYHRGVSHALDGQVDKARAIFESLARPSTPTSGSASPDEYARLMALVAHPRAFANRVTELIDKRRFALRLPAIENPLGMPAGEGS